LQSGLLKTFSKGTGVTCYTSLAIKCCFENLPGPQIPFAEPKSKHPSFIAKHLRKCRQSIL
jgi:hypothetical protein